MESFALSFASMLLALALVIAIAWLVLRLMRTRLQGRAPRDGETDEALRFVRALPVGAKERVVLIEHRGERWMLGVTAGGISTLAHWDAKPAATLAAAADAGVPPPSVGKDRS